MAYTGLGTWFATEHAADWLYQLLILNGRLFLLLAICLLLVRAIQGSAARRHLIITSAFIAAPLLPLFTQWIPPLEFVVEVNRPLSNVIADTGIEPSVASITAIQPSFTSLFTRYNLPLWLFAGYCSVALIFLARMVQGNISMVRLTQHTHQDGLIAWQLTLNECAEQLHVKQTVDIRHCPALGSPMTWGTIRPVIFIPTEALDWNEQLQRSALLHELAHIKRKDCLTKHLVQFVCAIYWVNPLCWLALRQFNNAAESASDDMALNSGLKHSHYAQNLLQVAKQASELSSPWSAALAMADSANGDKHCKHSDFGNRVKAILNPDGCRQPINWACLVFSFLFMFGFLLPLSSIRASVVEEITYVVDPTKVVPMPIPVTQPLPTLATEPQDYAFYQDDMDVLNFRKELKNIVQALPPTLPSIPTKAYVELSPQAAFKRAADKIKESLTSTEKESNQVEQPTPAAIVQNPPTQLRLDTFSTVTDIEPVVDFNALTQEHYAAAHFNQWEIFAAAEQPSVEPYRAQHIVTPDYPRRAQSRQIEGELTVEFGINQTGEVVDAKIISANPSGIFDRAVLRALQKNRYTPQKVDGKAVPVSGLQEKYVFVLET